jgi:hypothetical protein
MHFAAPPGHPRGGQFALQWAAVYRPSAARYAIPSGDDFETMGNMQQTSAMMS